MAEQEQQFDATGLDLSKFLPKEDVAVAEVETEEVETEVEAEAEAETEEETEAEAETEFEAEAETELSPDDEILADETLDETTKESIRELLLKIDGKEVKEELPFDLPPEAVEYLTQKFQMAGVAQKRMQEAAETNKKFDKFITDFKGNPEELMRELNMDSEEFAEAIIERKIAELSKTDEEKAEEERETELTRLRKENERLKNEEEQRTIQKENKQNLDEITLEINSALDEGGLPQDEFIRQRVASVWHDYIMRGTNVSVNEVVGQVRGELQEILKKTVDVLPDDALETYVGKKTIDRIRKKKRAKAPETLNKVKETVQKKDKVTKKKKNVNLNDWMRNRSGSLKDMID